jgi:hypothetical protein
VRRSHRVALLFVLALAPGCEQLLGIEYTEHGTTDQTAGAGSAGGTDAGADADAGAEAAGTAAQWTGDMGGAGGDADGQAGSPGLGAAAGAAGAPEAGGAAGLAEAGGTAGAAAGAAGAGGDAGATSPGGPIELLLSPSDLPPGSLGLWLDAAKGVTNSGSGSVTVWQDQSKLHLRATPPSATSAPKQVLAAFGEYPGIRFDGIDDILAVPDASSLRVGTEPFVLEFVVINLSSECCQQMIYMKQQDFFPYAGVSAAVNFYTSHLDPTPPATGEFATFLTLTPDLVCTPFSDTDDYRDGKPRVVSMIRTRTDLSLLVNGQLLSSKASEGVDASAVGFDLLIGAHSAGSLAFKGLLAELVLARGVSVYEALALDRSLRAKYADALKK